jgi:cytochrome c peroxidase
MEFYKKLAKNIIFLTIGFLVITIGLSYFVYIENQTRYVPLKTETNLFFCGTPNLSEEAFEGKSIFNSNCAACHKLDSRATGPALRGTDSLTYKKWMYYKNVKIDSTKLELWKRDYHLAFAKKGFNEEQLKYLYNYISGE